MLVEGYRKLVVLNQIEYLKHMSYHPTGLVLHPNTVQIIENVHYLVNNNLPVNKFVSPISPRNYTKSCPNSSRQKSRSSTRASSASSRRNSSGRRAIPAAESASSGGTTPASGIPNKVRPPDTAEVIDLEEERQAIFQNMEEDIGRMLEPHQQYIKLVEQGKTPFRSSHHMIATLLSSTLNLKLTPE